MKFERFMLDDYLSTADGAECHAFFQALPRHFKERAQTPVFYSMVSKFVGEDGYASQAFPSESEIRAWLNGDYQPGLEILRSYRRICDIDPEAKGFQFFDYDDFRRSIRIAFDSPESAKRSRSHIALLSVVLFEKFPDYSFPLLFPRHFYMTRIACSSLGIPLPPLPRRHAHVKCAEFYFDLCAAIYKFRLDNGLSPVEMCVLFYGYARRFSLCALVAMAHRGNQVFLLYCNPECDQLERHLSPEEKTIWQGSEEMFPGDIILMYERAPISAFSVVWEVATPGTPDPFYWTDGEVFITHPKPIPKIAFSEFMQNPVWSKNPLLAAHMQNGSCRPVSAEEYYAVLQMAKSKNPSLDLDSFPHPQLKSLRAEVEIGDERDVERLLLEPFLKSLGFTEKDWVRQEVIRTGRNSSSRPDYLIGLDRSGTTPRADIVFEAKKSLGGERQKCKDMGQAVAYGNIVNARIVVLFGAEGLVYSERRHNFDFNHAKFHSLAELSLPDVISELRQLFVPKF